MIRSLAFSLIMEIAFTIGCNRIHDKIFGGKNVIISHKGLQFGS